MGILSKFLKPRKSKVLPNDSYSTEVKRCLVEIKLNKTQYETLAVYYYKGSTSFRDFLKHVFMNKITKIKEVSKKAAERSKEHCNIDFTFIRFIHAENKYIDIPFEVFSNRKNMTINKRKRKLWHMANINRILISNPNLKTLDNRIDN
jgi:hypothetical protein